MCLFCATYNNDSFSNKQKDNNYEYLQANGVPKCQTAQDGWSYPFYDYDKKDENTESETVLKSKKVCFHEFADSGFRKSWCKFCACEGEMNPDTGEYEPNGK